MGRKASSRISRSVASFAEATGHEEPKAYLLGFAAYVAMVQPEIGAKLRSEVNRICGLHPTG